MANSTARIPVKVHRNVALVRLGEPILAEELLARKTLSRSVLGRLSETVLLIESEACEAVLDELKRMGHTPRFVKRDDAQRR